MVRNRAVIFAYFWIIVGLLSIYYALTYGFFNSGIPQAGFFPAIAGTILLTLSIINAISLHRQEPKAATKEGKRLRVAAIILAIGFYVAMLNSLGFGIVTPITVFLILRIIQVRSILFLSAVSMTTTIMLYIVFHSFLKVQFPMGILSF
jgi:putative tricarboxylic transport membrane protein